MTINAVSLTKGANTPLANDRMIDVIIEWTYSPAELDISCFMVTSQGTVPSDDYMIFYNQPTDPEQTVKLSTNAPNNIEFKIDLQSLLSSKIQKCVFAATLDGEHTFKEVKGCRITVKSSIGDVTFIVDDATDETSLVLAEIYRFKDWYKIRAVGRGFNGGLKPLAEAHGVTIEDSEEVMHEPEGIVERMPTINLSKMDVLKKKVTISLEKKNLTSVKARVAVVIDASGSMSNIYAKGTVQRAFERIVAIASCMDDDGVLDVWFFGSKFMRAPSVSEREYEGYVERIYPKPRLFGGVGVGNNEPLVMADIINKFTVEELNTTIPTYVIFFSDGGIYEEKKISKTLIDSSKNNIFWQFVGIGNANYGVLRNLDNLSGRLIDNANFFALDDLDKVSDEDLYDRLFNEFPIWLKEARKIGIVH